jgi:hypothetical protein
MVCSLLGIALGCILGLLPLLFIDSTKKELQILFDEIDEDSKGKNALRVDATPSPPPQRVCR